MSIRLNTIPAIYPIDWMGPFRERKASQGSPGMCEGPSARSKCHETASQKHRELESCFWS